MILASVFHSYTTLRNVALVGILGLAWSVLTINTYASRRLRALMSAETYPELVHGWHLDLEGATDTLATWSAFPREHSFRRHLVLVLEPKCPFCRRNLPNWERLLNCPLRWPDDFD